ncbi:MAG TPA: galactose oxidase [Armatimonadota bacterium]|nr:galactose oxidase [Armatimonadota bacterium]
MHEVKQAPDWECATRDAGWRARDSMGEFVYDGHLWILGGWFAAQEPNPLDVWKSPDGKHWTCVQEHAPWVQSDLPVSLVFDGRMWIMGGRKLPGTECSNKVWSSTDGVQWTLEGEAGWCPRVAAGFAVFKDRMWVMSGTESFYDHSDRMVKNDVWSSPDGKAWELVTPEAPWSKRAHGQVVVFKEKLWILGGGRWHPEHAVTSDVWCSEDGAHWTQVTEAAPWAPRIWFSALVYRDRLWVLGGWSKEHGNFGDVWCSENGRDWIEVRSNVIWTPRHEHAAYVFQDRIWVAGGYAERLSNEVWSLEILPEWFEAR